eukprot:CAMPEP_0171912212 /NCGR_PEP_ID=MMETSP0993-20121228/10905_1 /TAXON_ID=483369 /ORGANISM="non described non described, Strain CCMP2098" /LENGTH=127 /DNA_ID=CAMNT_0012545949 /DNA_START=208 /DNA_END=589 /DNA_ORIENTATION=-
MKAAWPFSTRRKQIRAAKDKPHSAMPPTDMSIKDASKLIDIKRLRKDAVETDLVAAALHFHTRLGTHCYDGHHKFQLLFRDSGRLVSSITGIRMSMSTKLNVPEAAFFRISTATEPSSATSAVHPKR